MFQSNNEVKILWEMFKFNNKCLYFIFHNKCFDLIIMFPCICFAPVYRHNIPKVSGQRPPNLAFIHYLLLRPNLKKKVNNKLDFYHLNFETSFVVRRRNSQNKRMILVFYLTIEPINPLTNVHKLSQRN